MIAKSRKLLNCAGGRFGAVAKFSRASPSSRARGSAPCTASFQLVHDLGASGGSHSKAVSSPRATPPAKALSTAQGCRAEASTRAAIVSFKTTETTKI